MPFWIEFVETVNSGASAFEVLSRQVQFGSAGAAALIVSCALNMNKARVLVHADPILLSSRCWPINQRGK